MSTTAASPAAAIPASILEKVPRLMDELPKHSKPAALGDKVLSYGTAGFRDNADILGSTFHRMGMLAVLRSKKEHKITGLMVTASHNAAPDNGVKLVDADGGMLAQSWEKYAMQLANANTEKVVEVLDTIIRTEKIDVDQTGNIFIARDTRVSSEHLSELAREGALLLGGNVLDFGLQTTPQLHHFIRMWNHEQYNKGDWASEAGYYNMLVDAFKQLTSGVDQKKLEMRTPLYVDCAHGVGAIQLAKLAKDLGDMLHIEIRNTPEDGELNFECGAEHAQKARKHPAGFSRDADRGKRACSLDGDADRVVFHYFDVQGEWHLLDGDKIACLFAGFFAEKLKTLELASEISLGVVQTAYANGAAYNYLKANNVQVAMAKTGVKYCHHKALDYDIGIYFEANGHGTVMMKDHVVDRLHKMESTLTDEKKKYALANITAAHQLINQAVGDALSDALFVEALLIQHDWSIAQWDAIYQDLPSRQTKVKIADRTVVKTTEDETAATAPEALKAAVESLVASAGPNARAFVRPSGTEDAVRVYAEAETQEGADALALAVAKAVHEHAGGIGDAPSAFVA
ncbi:phosphoacetylglucosamine mutase [Thraustotheca clavata]|uniref:Phosphoacetylglucosamine mutase n=1 Tax=Thraustotheca clavata TaxID=74557 RepID=A0A1V9ZH13_9STRA|nr:phosphoacetylglucosamine mutase [Thraustotheca clavata]